MKYALLLSALLLTACDYSTVTPVANVAPVEQPKPVGPDGCNVDTSSKLVTEHQVSPIQNLVKEEFAFGHKNECTVKFDITVNGKYLAPETTHLVTSCDLELSHVEVLYIGTWNQEVQDKFTFNNFIEGTKVPHEGIVIKHTSGERQKVAKVINPDYLIYGEKNDVGDSH
jgi:hypothetical protein